MLGRKTANALQLLGAPKRVTWFSLQTFVDRKHANPASDIAKGGAPGEIRTPDPLVRSQMLYPAELRAHRGWSNEFTKMESGAQRQVAANNSLAWASRCLLNRGVRKQLNDSGHPSRLYNDCQRYDVCTPARVQRLAEFRRFPWL